MISERIDKFTESLLEMVSQVRTEDLQEFFNGLIADVKAEGIGNVGVELVIAIRDYEIERRKRIETKKIIDKMAIPWEYITIIFSLKGTRKDDSLGLIDIFNYGRMMGKREERAKRKAHR